MVLLRIKKINVKTVFRYAGSVDVAGVALILPTGVALLNQEINLSTQDETILLHRVFNKAIFFDSSSGIQYDVTERANWTIPSARFINFDFLDNSAPQVFQNNFNQNGRLEIIAGTFFNINRRISLINTINGGDVVFLTGQTPAAGDLVFFSTNIQYSTIEKI